VKERQLILAIVLIVAGVIATFALNFLVLDPLFIPDICYYHNHDFKTSWVFGLFYSFPPDEGGHPAPSSFNFLFTITTGGLLGWLLAKYILPKKITLSP